MIGTFQDHYVLQLFLFMLYFCYFCSRNMNPKRKYSGLSMYNLKIQNLIILRTDTISQVVIPHAISCDVTQNART